MSIHETTHIKKCPGYKHLRRDGLFSPSCGLYWDASPAPQGEGALCPRCWEKPIRKGKIIWKADGSEHLVNERAVEDFMGEKKDKVIVHEVEPQTEAGQNWDEAAWDQKIKEKKKERPFWARWGRK